MTDQFEAIRLKMVRDQIESRGIRDPKILSAMRGMPRHLFMEPISWSQAYEDRPVPIGLGQTISQPFMVAYMAERLEAGGRKVLEVGTGSGYTTAILSRVAAEVFSVEIEPELSQYAGKVLESLDIRNVRLKVGDGMAGWPEAAPFARILLTAAVEEVPSALIDQLEVGGKFLGPLGRENDQVLVQIVRTPKSFEQSELMKVFFVEAHQTPAASYFSNN